MIYYHAIKNELHRKVVTIKSHDKRLQVCEEMPYVDKYYNIDTWESLSPVMVKEAKRHFSPFLDSGMEGGSYTVAFDVRMYYVENDILRYGTIRDAGSHVKTLRLHAQYLIKEKASVPQVRNKAEDLKRLQGEDLWECPTVEELEKLRISLRDLMQYLKGSGRKQFDIDISDTITESDYQPEGTAFDIRTYREKVIDYLVEHSDNPVIKKIYNLEPINNDDLGELEKVLWHELGSRNDYDEATNTQNLAAFVRSLIGLSQEAVNEKFGEYLNGNTFNSQQQEFIQTIINYVRENGDIELEDMVNTEPFSNYDLNEMFGTNVTAVVSIVNVLHESVVVQAA